MEPSVRLRLPGKPAPTQEDLDSSAQTSTIPKRSNLLLAWNFLVLVCYIFNIFEVPIALFFTDAVYYAETTVLLP
jgi:hypothetical protein